jgi:hypothetical protein
MYGESHIKIIENFSSHPHIKAQKNFNHSCPSKLFFKASKSTQGKVITDKNL